MDDETLEALADLLDGDDELGWDDELGAAKPRRTPFGGRRPVKKPASKRKALMRAIASRMQGGDNPKRDFIMPFPAGTFTAAVTTLSLPQGPQKPFVGRRLVIDFGRVGTTSTGLVTITNLAVGVDPQFVATGSVPANAFSPTAVGTRLEMDASEPGITITMQLAVAPAPTMTDTIAVSAALIGPAVS
jgi:hypothetical protein